jgi:hypothetical protein
MDTSGSDVRGLRAAMPSIMVVLRAGQPSALPQLEPLAAALLRHTRAGDAAAAASIVSVVGVSHPSSVPRQVQRQASAAAGAAAATDGDGCYDEEDEPDAGGLHVSPGHEGAAAAQRAQLTGSAADDVISEYLRGATQVYAGGDRLQISYARPPWPRVDDAALPAAAACGDAGRVFTLAPPRAFVQPNTGAAEQILRALGAACAAIAADSAAAAAGGYGSAAEAAAASPRTPPPVAAVGTLWDLYCGGGLLGLALVKAGAVRRVIGLEMDPDAVASAQANARLNGMDVGVAAAPLVGANGSPTGDGWPAATFLRADLAQVLPVAATGGSPGMHHPPVRQRRDSASPTRGKGPLPLVPMPAPDAVLVDPPRAGLSAPLLEQLRRVAPPYIVYVSCNPASQAKDIAALCGWPSAGGAPRQRELGPQTAQAASTGIGAPSASSTSAALGARGDAAGVSSHAVYELAWVQPVDSFPHAAHVETVALLRRRLAQTEA